MAYIDDDWLLYEYERTAIVKNIENNLNQINQKYFGATCKTLFVTDNGDYVTVKGQGMIHTDYDTQKLFDALDAEHFHEFCKSRGYSSWKGQSGLFWNYLSDCRYAPQENQRIDNRLITKAKYQRFKIDEAKYQELFSEKKPLLSFSSLRKIIAGYYPVIVDEKDGHYYYYHIEWMRQCDVIKFKGNGVICPLKLLIPSIFSVIW